MIYTNDIIKKRYNNKKKIYSFFRIISFPFIIAIVLGALYIGFAKLIQKENSVSIFGFRQYVVATGSMQPTYNVGDLIVTKKVKKEDIKLNDVITFSINNGGDTVTHRVIYILEKDGETFYKTKGDNNNTEDIDLVSYEQVKGKVVYNFNQFGVLLFKLTSGAGPIVVFAIATLSYIHTNNSEEKRIAREIARRRYNIPKYKREETV